MKVHRGGSCSCYVRPAERACSAVKRWTPGIDLLNGVGRWPDTVRCGFYCDYKLPEVLFHVKQTSRVGCRNFSWSSQVSLADGLDYLLEGRHRACTGPCFT